MEENEIKLPTLNCLRCGHHWFPKRPQLPKICPTCKSPYWNKIKTKYNRTEIRPVEDVTDGTNSK